ncbi:MAG: hypothetical protein M1817_004914 [Caeruleum heppii]|nr:MAG: hypothetical protein M1817_004914 [Caeruleum heppii]
MVKSYLKYEHSSTFATINTATANTVWVSDQDGGNTSIRSTGAGRAVVPANEEVLCWDLKKGELLSRWADRECRAQVSAIAQSRGDPDIFAVGYDDGSIRLWDSKIAEVIVRFNGHRSAITTLAFDRAGVRLASGAKDTDVIIWDLVAEVGLFKLRGHKDQVTAVHFVHTSGESDQPHDGVDDEAPNGHTNEDAPETFLLTTGKDALIKLWDVASQHCIETHVAQTNGECWALGVSPDGSGCVTAGNDGELKVWSLDTIGLSEVARQVADRPQRRFLHDRGILLRQGKDRTLSIVFHPKKDYFAVHGSEKAVEIWRIRPAAEVQKSLARKRKRKREKAAATANGIPNGDGQEDTVKNEDVSTADVSEVFVSYVIVRTGGKVRSIDWASSKTTKAMSLLVSTTNNQLELYNVPSKSSKTTTKPDEPPDYSRSYSVDLPGHRTDVRALSISSDDKMLASASSGTLKVWNVRTQTCIRTFDCGYALCCSFLPGDKIIVVGTKSGEIELFDVASSTLLDTVKAHEGPIWTLQVHPDGRSLVTGSADKSAKFWKFEIIQEEIPGTRRTTPRLKLVQTRTLKVTDDILSLRFSPDARLLACSLLDNTIKVFFTDTLKLFLNLYGHKLPVLHMDISFDSKLLVSCSADKNVRLWGLDFGDCRKALFAHSDSIMQVSFLPHNHDRSGHHFFSASKDHSVKYWDGDKFEQIQKLEAHHGEIWALAMSHSGEFFVTASHDKSLRVFEQSDEQIFLEEEREKELEALYESTLTSSLDRDNEPDNAENGPSTEVVAAGKQTVETLMAGEKIIEALELGMADLQTMEDHRAGLARHPKTAPPQRHPLFTALGNISAEKHVLSVFSRIPTPSLQDALLVLPFSCLPSLFTFLALFAEQQLHIPLTCRILFFMLRTHHPQIVASGELKVVLERVREGLREALGRERERLGFNLAGLRVVGRRVGEVGKGGWVGDEIMEEWEEEGGGIGGAGGRKKRGFVDVA